MQIGAGIASALGRRFGLGLERVKGAGASGMFGGTRGGIQHSDRSRVVFA